jgi:serine/threonine protein kinase
MSNECDTTYQIIDILKRPNSNNDEYQDPVTYLTYDKKDKYKTKYVLKIFDLEKMTNLSEFIKDTLWYKQLNHINLMPLRDCFLVDTKLHLIKPYASVGSCTDLLSVHPFGVREQLIAHIMWQLLQALRYLQDRYLLHRAISSKNIYLCDNGRVLLDNFSHCISMISPFDGKLRRQIYDYTDDLKDEILYLAPEIIYQNADGYNFKSDVYSLGTVACELANGSNTYVDMPFGSLSMLYAKIQGSEPILLDQTQLTEEMIALSDDNSSVYVEEIKKRRYTKEFHSFVKSCVATRLESRCSVDELFTHSFVKHPRKISNDPENLADDIAKNLNFYKRQESIDSDATNIDQIIDDSNTKSNSINLTWEF